MARVVLAASSACLVCGTACSKIAESLITPPTRDAASIVLHSIPDSLFVGDSAGASAEVVDKDGRPAWNDTVVVWASSDPVVASLDATHAPSPSPSHFSWLYGKTSGAATITAHTNKVTASKSVTVIGAADIGKDDQRFAYALADQPSVAGPYAPAAATRLNSGGGPITVTRDSSGWYNVRFAGLGRRAGQRDNVQVTAYGAPPGIHCKLLSWVTVGADMIVPVHCHDPSGAAIDARYTILLSGARAYDLTTPFAFAERLPQTQNVVLDTSATAFNSVSGHVQFGRTGVGSYNFAFLGFSEFTGPASFHTTSINQSADHCRTANYTLNGGYVAFCHQPDGTQADGRVTVMMLTRGRAGHRYAYASTVNLSAAAPTIDPALTFNSSGGAITSQRLGVGQWRVTFAGLGRPAGASDIAIASALKETDHLCSVVSWGNAGVADLTVTVQCFTPAGTPTDARFSLLVIE